MALGNNDEVVIDLVVNGKPAVKSMKDVENAQDNLSKSSDKTTKNIKTNWTAVGAAAAVVVAGMGAMMKQAVELERSLFGLNEETKEWIKNASEQYGMSQQLIAGFVQTGNAAGMAGQDIQVMIDQAIALGRAYPHESTESFIDNLVMLNRTGEAQGYIVDILEQKYGLIDLKTLSLEQKQIALAEATKGVNAEFEKTSASDYDKAMTELENTSASLGASLMALAEESGMLWMLNKLMDAGSLAATGYAIALNRVVWGAQSLAGVDTSGIDEAYDKLVKLSDKIQGSFFGTEEDDGSITLPAIGITGTAPALPPVVAAASSGADKERSIALAANARFWDDYNRATLDGLTYEQGLLDEQYDEYAKHVTDKVALDEWYAAEKLRLLEMYDLQMQAYADMGGALTQGLTDGILEFTETGKLSFKEMANSILQDMLRIQIQSSMMSLFGGFSSQGGGMLGGAFDMLFNAKGNAFNGGSVTPFANGGVVDGPTVFPMANGAGLMGEAGPEAIVPLTRTSTGNLGVEATAPVVNVNVENYGNDNVQVQQNGDNISVIISQIAQQIQRGTGDVGPAIESRYGIRKQ